MKVFGLAGWSGSGKTTLLEELIPRLTAAGLRVSLIKHAHHRFDIDHPGKDSYRLREAGCSEVLLISDREGIEKAGNVWASITVPTTNAFITPLLYAIPVQLLAYYAAIAKGTDVDQPRNLAKSVTVE